MAKRRRQPRSPAGISPESRISMSLQQILVVAGCLLAGGSGYAYLIWNQSTASKDISDIKSSVALNTAGFQKSIQTQDTKREQLGKDFLASTDKIAERVAELNTAVAVEQSTQKQMADTLQTISNQLGELTKIGKGSR